MPTKLSSYAVEKSTFAVGCVFTDEVGIAVTPDSITWSLVDDDGNVINSLSDQSIAASATVTIVLSGDDLQLRNQSNESELRYLEVSAVIDTDLGNNLPVKDRAEFRVLSLQSIT